MIYRVIGLMSGSSLDGLDIAYIEFEEKAGKWKYTILEAECISYSPSWENSLATAPQLPAIELIALHSIYGHYLGEAVNRFIQASNLEFKVALIVSHGHTVFHYPGLFTFQLGDGAAIAAKTSLPVVSDLRAMDIALGGQGAPIVPLGERVLFEGYDFFLNIGGISNLSFNAPTQLDAFDVCPANKVLNLLSIEIGKEFDAEGMMASSGRIHEQLFNQLNELPYYKQEYPKSLDNSFGINIIHPLIKSHSIPIIDALATYVEHIAFQLSSSIGMIHTKYSLPISSRNLLVTGGGAFNNYLIARIEHHLAPYSIEVILPDEKTIQYKEALIMGFLGILRWREEDTVMSSVTGASRNSIGGALWMGGH